MESTFLVTVLSFISLLLISWFTYIVSKKYKFPYTVLLALVWIALIPILKIPFFAFLDDFALTPDILFYIFLPVLIFESWYNIKYARLIENWKSIWILSVFWLLISAVVIAFWLYFFLGFIWWEVPLSICFLFGAIISATDPVAVLALFKEVWAPRRLSLIFEWESLFNDWTALALFLVVFEIIQKWSLNAGTITTWILTFFSMIVWWILFWIICSYVFSLIIWKVKNMESVEISFTIILAHLVFLLSELISEHIFIWTFQLKISWVIATSVAAILLGNYWRYKISPKVEKYMEKFWSFFAFIANSLVFILMWLILSQIKIDFTLFILPIVLVILVVMIARTISVYLPISIINYFKLEETISKTWQKLLAWWSLRWGLWLMMVFLIPDSFSVPWWSYSFSPKDFLLALTIWCIFFTLFVKAPTIWPMLKKFKENKLNKLEELENYESQIQICYTLLDKINNIYDKWHLNEEEYSSLQKRYTTLLENNVDWLKKFLKEEKDAKNLVRQAVMIHALGIEKQALKILYEYNEVNEDILRYLLTKIERQTYRVEKWLPQTRSMEERERDAKNTKVITKILKFFWKFNEESILDNFLRYRAQAVISNKVISSLQSLISMDIWYDKKIIEEVIETYKSFNTLAESKLQKLYNYDKQITCGLNTDLINKHLMILKEKMINDLFERELISPKIYHNSIDEVEEEIYKTIKIS